MAKIKFERTSAPTASVEFSRNPSRGDYQRTRKYLQPMDYADGGDVYIYNKGLAKNIIELDWRNIPKADYDAFKAFLDVVNGSQYNFIFTDVDAVMYTARIINPDDMRSAPVMADRESLSVKLLIEGYVETLSTVIQSSASAVEA